MTKYVMKRKVFICLALFITTLSSSITAFVAPEIMADGGIFDAEYARRHSGHVSEDKGYQIGSQVSRYSGKNKITLTYQGNDVWIGSDGYTWRAYLDKNDNIRWDGDVR